jgi:hypothetical protein
MSDNEKDVEGLESRPDPAAEHGDSPEEVDEADHDLTDPSNDFAENQVNDLLGGNFPLR